MMKMGYDMKLAKSFSRVEPQKLGIGVLAGFLVSLVYLSMSQPYTIPLPTVNSRPSSMVRAPESSMIGGDTMSSQQFGMEINVTRESKLGCVDASDLCEKDGGMNRTVNAVNYSSSITTSDAPPPSSGRLDGNVTQPIMEKIKESVAQGPASDGPNSTQLKIDVDLRVPINSLFANTTTISAHKDLNISKQSDKPTVDVKQDQQKPMCNFSNRRSNICEMDGEIRVHGKSSSITFMTSSQRNESWLIKPYARKSDLTAMSDVTQLHLKSSDVYHDPPRCTVKHSIPAIVFSVAGYTGNYFHDFTDVLVPLFLTSYQSGGEVQFLVTNFRSWWINKYLPFFKKLSRYEVIDLDHDDRVHCFPHTIVGLNAHDDLTIDPSKSPNGYSMVDFTKLMRSTYSLPRESPITVGKDPGKKPRLLIIARGRTRRFTNLNSIVKMAEKVGFEVVVTEAQSDVAEFAKIVNSCDVMMGVHGAGLTNLVFLPTNAIFIQIVPWGRLDWIARTYFRVPAESMKLRYLEYSIKEEESTLLDLYPRDHPVIKDPMSVHKNGWPAVMDMYLSKQNVKLNVRRFRAVLKKAHKLLGQ